MKSTIYYLLSLLLLSIIVYTGVSYYISNKEQRLHTEISNRIEQQFNGHDEIVDILYNNNPINYWEINIPDRNAGEKKYYSEDYEEDWHFHYDGITKLWSLNSNLSNTMSSDMDKNHDGWRMVIAKPSKDGIIIKLIFPYGVGLLEQESFFSYFYSPKIEDVVSSSIEWYTQNKMSEYSRNFQYGKFESLNDDLRRGKINNEYYSISYFDKSDFSNLPCSTSDSIWDFKLRNSWEFTKTHVLKSAYTCLYVAETGDIPLNIIRHKDAIISDYIKLIGLWMAIGIIIISLIFYFANKSSTNTVYSRNENSSQHIKLNPPPMPQHLNE